MIGILLFAAMAAAQSSSLGAPPEMREAPPACRCEGETPSDILTFEGIVVDAEVRLAANMRDPDPRQATVFRVSKSSEPLEADTVKVWHITDMDKCGVKFDYGRRYSIAARKVDDELETDYCLDPRFQSDGDADSEDQSDN